MARNTRIITFQLSASSHIILKEGEERECHNGMRRQEPLGRFGRLLKNKCEHTYKEHNSIDSSNGKRLRKTY